MNPPNLSWIVKPKTITNTKVRMEKLHELSGVITLLSRRNLNLQSITIFYTLKQFFFWVGEERERENIWQTCKIDYQICEYLTKLN